MRRRPQQRRTRGQTQFEEIVGVGFTPEQVSLALKQSERDPNRALCLLLEQAAAAKVLEPSDRVQTSEDQSDDGDYEQRRTRGQTQFEEIVGVGFTPEQVSLALKQSERDPNRALCLLLEQAAAAKVLEPSDRVQTSEDQSRRLAVAAAPEDVKHGSVEWQVGQHIEARFLAQRHGATRTTWH